jgi:quinol monooxygenase YgiN
MEDFFVVISLYAKPGREQALRGHLIEVVEPSRRDPGSLRYELFQDQADPRRFVFVEHWASPADQERHHTWTPHIQRFNEIGAPDVERIEFLHRLRSLA